MLELLEDALHAVFVLTSPACCCRAIQTSTSLAIALRQAPLWQYWCSTHFEGALKPSSLHALEHYRRLYTLAAAHWRTVSVKHGAEQPPVLEYAATCATKNGLLLFGGRRDDQGNMSNQLWLLDLLEGTWRQPIPDGTPTPGPRCFNGELTSMVLLSDRFVLVFGGLVPEGFRDNETWCLDMLHLEVGWREVQHDGHPQSPARPAPRYHHTLAVVGGSCVLWGGHDYRMQILDDYATLDPAGMFDTQDEPKWQLHSTAGRAWHTATPVDSTDLVVFGGLVSAGCSELQVWRRDSCNGLHIHDPDAHGSPPSPRIRHTAAKVGKCILVYGGLSSSASTVQQQFFDLHRLDMSTWCWSQIQLEPFASIAGCFDWLEPMPGLSAASAVLYDRVLVLFGGTAATSLEADDYVYSGIVHDSPLRGAVAVHLTDDDVSPVARMICASEAALPAISTSCSVVPMRHGLFVCGSSHVTLTHQDTNSQATLEESNSCKSVVCFATIDEEPRFGCGRGMGSLQSLPSEMSRNYRKVNATHWA